VTNCSITLTHYMPPCLIITGRGEIRPSMCIRVAFFTGSERDELVRQHLEPRLQYLVCRRQCVCARFLYINITLSLGQVQTHTTLCRGMNNCSRLYFSLQCVGENELYNLGVLLPSQIEGRVRQTSARDYGLLFILYFICDGV
jgi:hypothetical protein